MERRLTMRDEQPFYTPAEFPSGGEGEREVLYSFTPLGNGGTPSGMGMGGYPFPKMEREGGYESEYRGDLGSPFSGKENARMGIFEDVENYAPGHGGGLGSGEFGFVGKEMKEGSVSSADLVRKEIMEGWAPCYRAFTR